MIFPPKTINGWATLVVGLALTVMAGYLGTMETGETIPLWAVLLNAGVGYLALIMRGGGVEIGKPQSGIISGMFMMLLVVAMAAVFIGCPSAHAPALKATTALKRATVTTSTALAAGSIAELQAGQDKAKICARLVAYRDNIRPAARSSVAAGLAAIQIAREASKDKLDIFAILRPGGCALILGLRAWGHKLPDKGASILPLLEMFQGVVCSPQRKPDASPALAVLLAVLPAAVDLVKWIVQLVGAPADKLEAEIVNWLQAPAADEVDAVIKKWCSAPAGGV